jgi:hypothetical protein
LQPSRDSKLKTRKFLKIKRETPFGLIRCMTAIQCFVVNFFFLTHYLLYCYHAASPWFKRTAPIKLDNCLFEMSKQLQLNF